jgi:acetyltransferase
VICHSADTLREAAETLGFPLVLKTAEAGSDHKSDLGGVILDLQGHGALEAAYADLASRLGPRVIVQKMAGKGIELAFGCVIDPDFGALVMVSPGGTLVEHFNERQFARAPFGPDRATAMIRRLKVARLIDGVRGEAPRDLGAAARALADFSTACAALAGHVVEADVNPVVVTETGAVAVDALIVAVCKAQRDVA